VGVGDDTETPNVHLKRMARSTLKNFLLKRWDGRREGGREGGMKERSVRWYDRLGVGQPRKGGREGGREGGRKRTGAM